MTRHYRISFESYESGTSEIVSKTVLMDSTIDKPVDVFNFGLSHEDQIKLIHAAQDRLLKEQIELIDEENQTCPVCIGRKLKRNGKQVSDYHDIFTDHKLELSRKRCPDCKYEPGATIKTLLGHSISADLIKIQSELGANYTYRESEDIFATFSRTKRSITNHDRIKHTSEQVGEQVGALHRMEHQVIAAKPASELVIAVDGGHINTIEAGKRSFEAMTAVVYRPEALVSNDSGTRYTLASKHCAASALDDGQQQMINNTIAAALKQGLYPDTHITALCDGAENCWQIAQALKPLCASMTCILDWFHLSMKIHNIALPEEFKIKLTRIKWHLWRGKTECALMRLDSLIDACPKAYQMRLEKLRSYIKNNLEKIIDYRARQKSGLVFTSNLAEATVESLINQRCKGQQHMRWSRKGLDPLLQLRAAIASNDWGNVWKDAVRNAIIQQ